MNRFLENKDLVQYDDPFFGKGTGSVVGMYKKDDLELYVIYPKRPFASSFWPYMTFVVPSDKIIPTPF